GEPRARGLWGTTSGEVATRALGSLDSVPRDLGPAAILGQEGGVNVLPQVDALRLNVQVQLLERDDLLRHRVPAVVDENVDPGDGVAHLGKEGAVGLVADENGGRRVLELPAARVDVDTDDARPGSEVVMPHLQRSAVESAHLDHHGRAAPEPFEVAMIDLEIMMPLVDEPARIVEEIILQRVRGGAVRCADGLLAHRACRDMNTSRSN